jgi:hypothetical protein
VAKYNPHNRRNSRNPFKPIYEPKPEPYYIMAVRARGEVNDRTYIFDMEDDEMLISSSNWHIKGYFKG